MTSLFTLLPAAVTSIDVEGKDAILKHLAGLFAEVYELDEAHVLGALLEREQLGSTGFGRRIAIPHARVEGLKRPVAAFIRLESPAEFQSADGLPVDLVFGLLSPLGAGATHLHALAAISRMMRDERMHATLVEATGPEAIYALLSNVLDRDAA
ncbi:MULTISPECIES: PTS sugar transporter subunit IIA [Novosphingobium]|uniref:PTS sugar transporter subunit IIA n=2 Tax=Novosphingobium TaxID=165696 RepID=A0ABT0AB13_9SPHN|nr:MULTISPECIES: PTS sugar transporter subunit IIA [Novosphingobium]MCJ1960384.1 PTS sugar transporter subunit IIA [Novosphingobium mangrovi (ex Hu et al. 2023)]MED5544164.1 PTS sugar transporter subunit IIA [Pseudomonadota bacterium]QVM84464.1 PTS sugar transporter subunit IIA [Novosphingobium decolorationis]